MPLNQKERDNVIRYCEKDVEPFAKCEMKFDFIDDSDLRKHLGLELYSSRYIYKLQEALLVDQEKLRAHCKFQIIQYASIYEAVIVYLLEEKFSNTPEFIDLTHHEVFKNTTKFPKGSKILSNNGVELFLCEKRKEKAIMQNIKFKDKLDASVKIGFLVSDLADEIYKFYDARNSIHLQKAAVNDTQYEIEQAKLAYWRLSPFIEGIKNFLGNAK